MKAVGLARDKVRNVWWKERCRLLSSCAEKPSGNFSNETRPREVPRRTHPPLKLSEAQHCHSNLRFRQRARQRSESGSRLTRNPSCLEVAGRSHHAKWRDGKRVGYYCHSGNRQQARGFTPAFRFATVVLVLWLRNS